MKSSTTDEWVEQHLDGLDYVGLAPLIQQHVIEMLDQALQLSQSAQREDKEAIHDLRVVFKRLRAYWRLVRLIVGKPEFEAADRRIKLVAKLLGGQRDQQVLLDSLSLISVQLTGAEKATAEQLLQQLNRSLKESRKALSIHWPTVISMLQLERSAWQNLNCEPLKNNPLQKGLRKSFKRQIELSEKATKKQAGSVLRHQWRKWVKHVYYQLNLLKNLGVKRQKKTVKRFDELGELLGLEHDLEVLKDFLEHASFQQDSGAGIDHLILACDHYKEDLYKRINRLAGRINKVF